MKTLKKGNEIKRVKDSTVQEQKQLDTLVAGGWSYIPKSEWKALRPKPKAKVEKEKKDNK